MAAADPRIRTIKIKSGVVKRLAKEKAMYEKEVEKEAAKIEKMKTEGKDEHEIKKQTEVMEESRMMIPDCTRRLNSGWEELSKLLENESDLADTEEFMGARTILDDTKSAAGR